MEEVLGADLLESVRPAVLRSLGEVDGSVAVIAPQRYAGELAPLEQLDDGRVRVLDALSTKGLEYDATAVVDPDEIVRESAGGIRTLVRRVDPRRPPDDRPAPRHRDLRHRPSTGGKPEQWR